MTEERAFSLAIANVSVFGDTDIFPFPLDKFPCSDEPEKVAVLLKEVHRKFESFIVSNPPDNINALAPLGYTSFRWATQIDPLWNLYFLSLVLMIAETIEGKRLSQSEDAVFSYRFSPDDETGHLFGDSTWRHYKQSALKKSREYPYVVVADVSEFYPRVSHHRLENELIRLEHPTDAPQRIKKLFSKFSQTRSYGLPVGGPASGG